MKPGHCLESNASLQWDLKPVRDIAGIIKCDYYRIINPTGVLYPLKKDVQSCNLFSGILLKGHDIKFSCDGES